MQQPPIWQRFDPGGHVEPQPPQLARSFWVSTQASPQHVSDAGQPPIWQLCVWQTPPAQDPPAGQMSPQVPQLFGSVPSSASQPSASTPLQSAKPLSQVAMWQAADAQSVVPWGTGPHTFPQPPQLFGSAWVLAQVAPQHVSLPGHTPPAPQPPTHTPPEQDSPAAQACPQLPQLAGSVAVSISQPSCTIMSQSAKPGVHAPRAQAEATHAAVASGKGPQVTPQPPQLDGSLVSSVHSGEQQVSPAAQAWPAPHMPTHWKSTQASPVGHWLLTVHATHIPVSIRQCGVAGVEAQSASVWHPVPGVPPVPPVPLVPPAPPAPLVVVVGPISERPHALSAEVTAIEKSR
jgi:hypothetical protein